MGMMDMLNPINAAKKLGGVARKMPGMKQVGSAMGKFAPPGFNQNPGIGPSPMALMGSVGARMGMGQKPMMQSPQMPQPTPEMMPQGFPQGTPTPNPNAMQNNPNTGVMKPMAEGFGGMFQQMRTMPQPMPQNYQQQGEAAGNDMSWMQQPGAISPEYQQPSVGPSPTGVQALLAKMRMKNTGVAGGRPNRPPM